VQELPSRGVDERVDHGLERRHGGFVVGSQDELAELGPGDAAVGVDDAREQRGDGFDGVAARGVELVNHGVGVEHGHAEFLGHHGRHRALAHPYRARQTEEQHRPFGGSARLCRRLRAGGETMRAGSRTGLDRAREPGDSSDSLSGASHVL